MWSLGTRVHPLHHTKNDILGIQERQWGGNTSRYWTGRTNLMNWNRRGRDIKHVTYRHGQISCILVRRDKCWRSWGAHGLKSCGCVMWWIFWTLSCWISRQSWQRERLSCSLWLVRTIYQHTQLKSFKKMWVCILVELFLYTIFRWYVTQTVKYQFVAVL